MQIRLLENLIQQGYTLESYLTELKKEQQEKEIAKEVLIEHLKSLKGKCVKLVHNNNNTDYYYIDKVLSIDSSKDNYCEALQIFDVKVANKPVNYLWFSEEKLNKSWFIVEEKLYNEIKEEIQKSNKLFNTYL